MVQHHAINRPRVEAVKAGTNKGTYLARQILRRMETISAMQ